MQETTISGFQFLLETFVLLMGLAMAEVLRGFARVLKLRARQKAGVDPASEAITIGWLVPLMGLVVILDQSTFFLHMYSYRETLLFNGGTVIGILLTIGWYYLIASLVFPDKPADWRDFDAWYWQQKRWIMGGVIGINAIGTIAGVLLATPEQLEATREAQQAGIAGALAGIATFAAIPAMFWLFFSKSKRVNIALLLVMVASPVMYGALTIGSEFPG